MRNYAVFKWMVVCFFIVSGTGCGGSTTPATEEGSSTGPQLSDVSSPLPLVAGTVSTTMRLETDINATCRYATTSGNRFTEMTGIFDQTGAIEHSTVITGLSDGATHTFYVRCVADNNGAESPELAISFTVNLPGNYTPPIGIPAPSFGIDESYRMYDDPSNRNAVLTYHQNSDGGYYTHYISDTGCTDSSNPYGTEATPRCSLPTTMEAGSVVIMQGISDGNQRSLTFNCTAAQPCWFRGPDATNPAIIRREIIVKGAYVILENLHFDEGDPLGMRAHNTSELHHAAVRHSELGRVGIYGHAGYTFNNLVIYHNEIHLDNFINLGPSSPEFAEHDTHGIGAGSYSEYVWVLDNDIHDVAGDAVGNAHNANYTARYYFIGGNYMHDTGENAVDFKEIENLVVSQNKAYRNYGPSTGSDGTAMVFHYGPSLSPRNAWILFNEIYDSSDCGIQIGGDVTDPIYVIGNVIHDISNPSGTADAIRSWTSSDIYLINNTLYGNDGGISITGDDTHVLTMVNNIVAEINNTDSYHLALDFSSYRSNAVLENNLFYQTGLPVRINWGAVYDVAGLQATGKCSSCREENPRFTDANNNVFSLEANSPAVEGGIENSIYADYATFYGQSITYDQNSAPRPSGNFWDIGAFERP